jgi:hypothetical protein
MRFSYSSLKDFEQCARRYHEVKVLQNYPREDTEATLYGKEVHTAAQAYTMGKPVPAQYAFIQPIVDALLTKQGRVFPEVEMALTVELDPCPWDDPQAWVRGIADLLIVDDATHQAWVVDYKTGSAKYPDKSQLDLMSLLVFAHNPDIFQVNSALIFVLKDVFIKHKRYRTEADPMWWDYRNRVAKIDKAVSNGVWNPKQSGLCKKHCPVLTCEFSGRNI